MEVNGFNGIIKQSPFQMWLKLNRTVIAESKCSNFFKFFFKFCPRFV